MVSLDKTGWNWGITPADQTVIVALEINGVTVQLKAGETIVMSTNLLVGQTDNLKIRFLDQFGKDMVTPPTLDSIPAWTASAPTDATLTVAADGLTASSHATAANPDGSASSNTITVDVVVGGVHFSATETESISPVQVFTSILVESTVDPTILTN